eukprot:372006_1
MSIIIYDIPFTLPHIYNPFNNSDYSNPDSSRILSPKPTPVSAPIEPSSPSVHAPDVLPQSEFDINAYFMIPRYKHPRTQVPTFKQLIQPLPSTNRPYEIEHKPAPTYSVH